MLNEKQHKDYGNLVYKKDYGNESHGEVIVTSEGLYKCYFIPLFGGERIEDSIFKTKKEAIEYLDSIT